MYRILIVLSLFVGEGLSDERRRNPLDNHYPELAADSWQLNPRAKLKLVDGEYWLELGGQRLAFSIPDDEVMESVAINEEGTFLWVSTGKNGRLDSLRRWEVARWNSGEKEFVAAWKERSERLLISRIFSVSKTGRYALLMIGKMKPSMNNPGNNSFTVHYDLRVFDFDEKKIKETGVDHWLKYRSQ